MDQQPNAAQVVEWIEEAHGIHAHIFGESGCQPLSKEHERFYHDWTKRIEAAIGRPGTVDLLASVMLAYTGAERTSLRLACRSTCIFGHRVARRVETEFCDSLAKDVGEENLGIARYDESRKGWSDQTKSLHAAMESKRGWCCDLINEVTSIHNEAIKSQAEVAS